MCDAVAVAIFETLIFQQTWPVEGVNVTRAYPKPSGSAGGTLFEPCNDAASVQLVAGGVRASAIVGLRRSSAMTTATTIAGRRDCIPTLPSGYGRWGHTPPPPTMCVRH